MKKLGFMLLAAIVSLLAFSPPTLAKPDPDKEAFKDEIRALKKQIQQTHDKQERKDLRDEIKAIRASFHA